MAKNPRKPTRVSDALRKAIRDSGKTPYAIAQAAGCSVDAIYRFLNDPEHQLRLDTVDKLAAALGMELRPIGYRGEKDRGGQKG